MSTKNGFSILYYFLTQTLINFLLFADISVGLNVTVTVPAAVRKGENANLICNYDLEGDPLYAVKWYKGRREFYRFTPKENPSTKVFPLAGITVEVRPFIILKSYSQRTDTLDIFVLI